MKSTPNTNCAFGHADMGDEGVDQQRGTEHGDESGPAGADTSVAR